MGQFRWLLIASPCSLGVLQEAILSALQKNPKPMKTRGKTFMLRYGLITACVIQLMLACCSQKDLMSAKSPQEDRFLSATFNHFESGVLFTDVESGLDVLWQASFKEGIAYKENLGYFVNRGLLILPNQFNTCRTARLSALPTKIEGGRLYVEFDGGYIEVFAMIHTHPDVHMRPEPSPRNDYQYCYLGLHSYVMDHLNLFDAYKDVHGREVYERLGARNSYHRIPINKFGETIDQLVAVDDTQRNNPD
jgi:hypothetical protein